MNRRTAHLPFALAAIASTIVLTATAADASRLMPEHTPNASYSCSGVRLQGSGYEEQHMNAMELNIDGGPAEVSSADFTAPNLDTGMFPIPQDGLTHTVLLSITVTGDVPDHPEYDLYVNTVVGPCGQQATTTTTELVTTTTDPGATSSTSTTTSSTSTTPSTSTSMPGSVTTTPPTSSTPTTTSTGNTTTSISPPFVPSTTPPAPSSATLPATGAPSWPIVVTAALLLSLGVSLVFGAVAKRRDEV